MSRPGCSHQPGEHDITCVPPADPSDPALRLLRVIYGLCGLCDRTDEHEHPCGICGAKQPLGDGSYCWHGDDSSLYM